MNKLLLVFFLSISVFISGCTSLSKVPIESKEFISNNVNIGDTVVVTTLSGQVYQFTIERVSGLVIEGEGVTIDIIDIEKIEKKEFSPIKTGGLFLGILGVIGALAGLSLSGVL